MGTSCPALSKTCFSLHTEVSGGEEEKAGTEDADVSLERSDQRGRPESSESKRRNPQSVSLQPAASSKREHGERRQQLTRAKRKRAGKPNVVLLLRKPGPKGQQPCAGQSTTEQANHEEDVQQRTAAEGVQAVSVEKPELVTKDAEGESEMRPEKAKLETVVIRKLVSWADFPAHLIDSIVFLYLNKTCCGLWRTALLLLCCIIVFSDTFTMLSIKQSVTELDIFQ